MPMAERVRPKTKEIRRIGLSTIIVPMEPTQVAAEERTVVTLVSRVVMVLVSIKPSFKKIYISHG